jgi:hypothetical protein
MMKLQNRISGLATGLLLGGLASVAAAQGQTDNHDLQFIANQGSPRMLVQTKDDVLGHLGPQQTWVQLTAGSITIPAGQTGYLVATFSGESLCSGTSGWCSLRVLVNGAEMNPVVGTNFAFDSADVDGWESHAIQRISRRLSGGPNGTAYTVEVQWLYTVNGITYQLDDWMFQVEYRRAS